MRWWIETSSKIKVPAHLAGVVGEHPGVRAPGIERSEGMLVMKTTPDIYRVLTAYEALYM